MGLESTLFKREYKYDKRFINVCIMRIRFGKRNLITQNGYKMYIFKMMQDIVKKNVCNYINLLEGIGCIEIPDRDEVIADCFVMLYKCISKFRISPKNSFYFYFNKSLSRNFYRAYQKEVRNSGVELTDAIATMHPNLRTNGDFDTIETLMDSLYFDAIDKRITRSRLLGQRTSEFLKKNKDITVNQYSKSLKKIKEIINFYKEHNQF